MNLYYFELTCRCRNGRLKDRYDCVLRASFVIQVERIAAFAKGLERQKLYQEEIADRLRNEFMARVTVTGFHYGIKIVCERE